MKKLIFLFTVLIALTSCGDTKSVQKKLNGKWQNNVMTVEIDFDKKSYNSILFGKKSSKKLELIKVEGNTVTLKTGENTITCNIIDNDNIILTKKGGIPIAFKRLK